MKTKIVIDDVTYTFYIKSSFDISLICSMELMESVKIILTESELDNFFSGQRHTFNISEKKMKLLYTYLIDKEKNVWYNQNKSGFIESNRIKIKNTLNQ
jgi:hypothetical protein